MSSELSKAQDNSKRFQELLTVERRKQKALQVIIQAKSYTDICMNIAHT